MLKIFMGADGYYVADERPDGFHHQGRSLVGFDLVAARRQLARQLAREAEEFEEELDCWGNPWRRR